MNNRTLDILLSNWVTLWLLELEKRNVARGFQHL